MQTIITILGTHCNACKMLIEDVAKDIPGVKTCIVDFQTGKTEIGHDESMDWDNLQKEIESLGKYKVQKN